MTTIQETLDARSKIYGDFATHAQLSQDLKDVMHCAPNWPELDHDMREALDMAQHKIARILNGGNPNYLDSWVDICGYIQLVINRLEEG